MKLLFSISAITGSDDVTRVITTSQTITCGSDTTADIRLDDLERVVFLIRQSDDSELVLEQQSTSVPIKVDGNEISETTVPIRNGVEIDVGNHRILLTVTFERASCSSRSGLGVMLSSFLIVAIIVTEVIIVQWLPRKIQTSELWGTEVLRQEALHSLDNLRLHITQSAEQKTQDPLFQPTLKLYKIEADSMALYIRANQSQLSTQQLKQFKGDLMLLQKQVHLLTEGTLIPPDRKLDATGAVDVILNEKDIK